MGRRGSAKAVRLNYVTDSMPGIRRRRAGKGFAYATPDGKPLRDKAALDRIQNRWRSRPRGQMYGSARGRMAICRPQDETRAAGNSTTTIRSIALRATSRSTAG